jgi:Fe-S-cluster containining protein
LIAALLEARPMHSPDPFVTAHGSFRVGEATVEVEVSVPASPTGAEALLPMLRAFSSEIVAVAVHREQAAGRQISCRAGCGACCRQLVPLSLTEARQLQELVSELPDAHRERVLPRFDEAVSRLREAGLLPRLERVSTMTRAERVALGLEYFALGIACPFLEAEACSIHEQRPLTCREYLVTSNSAHCAEPASGRVVGVRLDASVLNAFLRTEATTAQALRYVPLVLAPYLRQKAPAPMHTGPEWIQRLVRELSGADVGNATDGLGPELPA